ncbi:hypothetical protein [Serratia nevei]|uniref:hypothetical protein n=1 Tax=Serratia nevei TaxID=2703794 RepID=UPI0036A27A1D
MSQPRTSEYPIDAQFIERWSPRAMANDAIDDQTLLSFFEAALVAIGLQHSAVALCLQ